MLKSCDKSNIEYIQITLYSSSGTTSRHTVIAYSMVVAAFFFSQFCVSVILHIVSPETKLFTQMLYSTNYRPDLAEKSSNRRPTTLNCWIYVSILDNVEKSSYAFANIQDRCTLRISEKNNITTVYFFFLF